MYSPAILFPLMCKGTHNFSYIQPTGKNGFIYCVSLVYPSYIFRVYIVVGRMKKAVLWGCGGNMQEYVQKWICVYAKNVVTLPPKCKNNVYLPMKDGR